MYNIHIHTLWLRFKSTRSWPRVVQCSKAVTCACREHRNSNSNHTDTLNELCNWSFTFEIFPKKLSPLRLRVFVLRPQFGQVVGGVEHGLGLRG